MLDESIAKGLKNSLWRSAQTEFKRLQAAVLPWNRGSRDGIRKQIEFLQEQFDTPLKLVSGGREGRRPLWWFIMLMMNENMVRNEWQENVFGFYFAGWRFRPYEMEHCAFNTRVCEHAVSRLYQRAPQNDDMPSLNIIYPELAHACIQGYFHFRALRLLSDEGESYSAFVPTNTGAFLGEISKCGLYLDLRTYIAEEQMGAGQRRLWNELKALYIYEEALKLIPDSMFEIGTDSEQDESEHDTATLILLLQKIIRSYLRLLGRKAAGIQ
jgi:hypothetical protein